MAFCKPKYNYFTNEIILLLCLTFSFAFPFVCFFFARSRNVTRRSNVHENAPASQSSRGRFAFLDENTTSRSIHGWFFQFGNNDKSSSRCARRKTSGWRDLLHCYVWPAVPVICGKRKFVIKTRATVKLARGNERDRTKYPLIATRMFGFGLETYIKQLRAYVPRNRKEKENMTLESCTIIWCTPPLNPRNL